MLLLSTRESNETKLSNILIIIFILEKIDGPISKLNQFQTTVTHPSPSLSKYFDGLSYEPRILRLSFHSRNFYFLTRHGVHKCVLGTRRDARAAYRTTPVFKENAGRGGTAKERWKNVEEALNTDIHSIVRLFDLQPHNSTARSTFPISKWYAHAFALAT